MPCFKRPAIRKNHVMFKTLSSFLKILSIIKARERAFYVFLVPTKKARKGCRERPALYHESLDYLSMFLDQVYERLKDSRNLPFLCMLRILTRKKMLREKEKSVRNQEWKRKQLWRINACNIVTKLVFVLNYFTASSDPTSPRCLNYSKKPPSNPGTLHTLRIFLRTF